MIVVTGGAGFIGSNLISTLNKLNKTVILVDDLNFKNWKNILGLNFKTLYNKKDFLSLIREYGKNPSIRIEAIIHLGATSSTKSNNIKRVIENNYNYSMELLHFCNLNQIRFIYTSSAATYGLSKNFSDNSSLIPSLRPLNVYALSKHLLDLHIINSEYDNVVGLKLFNVYGNNEDHKGNMKSFISYVCDSIYNEQYIDFNTTFKYKHNVLSRDFIHVNDVIDIIIFMLNNKNCNGIFNVGTGKSIKLQYIIEYVNKILNKGDNRKLKIQYITKNTNDQLQPYTKADISKLRNHGYNKSFISVEDGILEYIRNLEDRNIC